ncbi:MAG: hypothetical protein JOZ57_13545 [Abitibacteriaceae bacterium]|nr:hypothetical protein [Abditibacteriaceae bacterium]
MTLPSIPFFTTPLFSSRTARSPTGLWLLVAVALISFTVPGLEPVLAQPMPAAKPLNFPPLTTTEQATISRVLTLSHQADICAMPVRLKVTRASLPDLVARLKPQLPQHILLEVRHTSPARFTLNLQEATLRQVLQAVADLSDCNFYLLPDRLLLATEDQLTPEERAEAEQSAASARSSAPQQYLRPQAMKALTNIIIAKLSAVQGQLSDRAIQGAMPVAFEGETVMAFGQLSPELQQTVQQWLNLFGTSSRLTPDATVSFAVSPQTIKLGVRPSLSSGHRGGYTYIERF